MSELEALNLLLRAIGSSPVNSLETPHPDAANGLTTLERLRRQLQKRGWWFNIDFDVILTPDVNGEILLPTTYDTMVLEDMSLIKRGNKIYNRAKQTYLHTDPVRVIYIIQLLSWDEMPGSMQEYVTYVSAGQFVRDELEDLNKEQDYYASAQQVLIDLNRQDMAEGRYNMFNNARVQQARAGVQPYQRNNKRFYGDPDV